MFQFDELEQKFISKTMSHLKAGAKSTALEKAAVFDKYVVPNKAFAEHSDVLSLAGELVEQLENEIKTLKGEAQEDRDELLGLARNYKRSIRGFITYADKELF